MAVYELDGVAPQVDPSAWVADSAQVIGDVKLAEDVSLWFGSVVRGDSEHLSVGAGTNVQDHCMLHADPGKPLMVGKRVTVGHQVTLHGCTVGDESMIGMGATVLNGAHIGRQCLVGAGALITEGKHFPDGSLILGAPARVERTLTPQEIKGIEHSAQHYIENARRFRTGLKKTV
jgi:carbonic anhydrase/acetyltransferase-like protein (isoleucine patch superfamily)